MKAVLDTNIIIGAAITPKGPPAAIIKAWRASQFTWVTSPALLEELRRALGYERVQRYLAWSEAEIQEFLDLSSRVALVVIPNVDLAVVTRDPADNRLLEAAVTGAAEYVVTNDNDLLDLKSYEAIEIVTAARFAALLSQGSRP
jgi:putative PIN family toxin of toxin-antitoxin system